MIKNKKSISIGDRLLNIAEMIGSCEVLLDVGTDHGLLPIYLLQEGIISNAIAVDICAGPLEQAKRNAQKYNLLNKIDFIISNGLSNVNRNFDYVTIAGLGSNTIIEILENAKNKLNMNCKIVVQSNNSCYLVRKWCISKGWDIVDERIINENNIYYEIVKFEYVGIKELPAYSEMDLLFGPILLKNKSIVLKEKIQKEQEFLLNLIRNIPMDKISAIEKNTLKYEVNKKALNILK